MPQPRVLLQDAARYTEVTALPENFDPPERITALILSDLCAHKTSFGDIADKAGTTFEALSRWMARPDIAQRIDDMEARLARRCRLQLANNSGDIMHACESIIQNYVFAESHIQVADGDWRGHAVMTRKASNALTAGRVLIELSRHFSNPPRQRRDNNDRAPLPPQQPAPTPDKELDPTDTNTNHESRFTNLPNLPSLFTPLKLHGTAIDPAHPDLPYNPSAPNPTRENGHTTHHNGDDAQRAAGSPRFAATGPNTTGVEAPSPCHEPPAVNAASITHNNHPPITDTMHEPTPAVRAEDQGPPVPPVHAANAPPKSAPTPADSPSPLPGRIPPPDHICNCPRGQSCNGCATEVMIARAEAKQIAAREREHRARDPTPARS